MFDIHLDDYITAVRVGQQEWHVIGRDKSTRRQTRSDHSEPPMVYWRAEANVSWTWVPHCLALLHLLTSPSIAKSYSQMNLWLNQLWD